MAAKKTFANEPTAPLLAAAYLVSSNPAASPPPNWHHGYHEHPDGQQNSHQGVVRGG